MKFDHLVRHNGIDYPAGTEVPVGVVAVEMTDDVPEDALEDNPDGSINVYDESGSEVGTVSKEEVEQFEAEAGEAVKAQQKRGKGSKKA